MSFFLAVAAAAFWCGVGWPLACRVLPRGMPAMAFAPLLGFCLHVAVAAPLLGWIGFSTMGVVGVALGLLGVAWLFGRRPVGFGWGAPVAAGLVALVPMMGVLAKGDRLSGPIFDHAKVAIVDAIARLGLPVVNPFYGGGGPLGYYWWWHFAAAEMARVSGVSGWGADAALTGVSAFAVVLALAGLAEGLGRGLGVWAVGLAVPASMRWVIPTGWLAPESGLGGVLNQASWAPQHVMAAGALVLAVLVLAGLAEAPSVVGVGVLAGCVAAGFGCSAWVGGVVGAVALPVAVGVLVAGVPAGRRLGFLGCAVVGGVVGVALVAGLIADQHAAAAGWGRAPVRLAAYPVFGAGWWDLAWLPLLWVVEFPVAAVLGGVGVSRHGLTGWRAAVVAVAVVGLAVMAVGRGALVNNDLGWRAALVPLLVLLAFAAAAVRDGVRRRRWWVVVPPALGLWGAWGVVWDDLVGRPPALPGPTLMQEAVMWRGVRAATGATARILVDPRLDAGRTWWAADIGWALLADRSSCFGGWAGVQAFAPMPRAALRGLEAQVEGVFDEGSLAADKAVARRLGCDAVLLTAGRAGWTGDAFARAGVAAVAGGDGWRLYLVGGG